MDNKNNEISTSALRDLISETDKRYEQRFLDLDKSKDIAFNAANLAISTTASQVKTAMETAFTAAEKVSQKTERFTEDKFKSIDSTLEQNRTQAMTFIPRQEWQITVGNLESSIKKIEEYQSQTIGAENNTSKSRSQNNWVIGILIVVVIAIINIALIKFK